MFCLIQNMGRQIEHFDCAEVHSTELNVSLNSTKKRSWGPPHLSSQNGVTIPQVLAKLIQSKTSCEGNAS